MNKENPSIQIIGSPKTVGELKKMIEKYDDETPFGFRGQPAQELYQVVYGTETFVVFQEAEIDCPEKANHVQ